jgi:hypothetical protein
VRRLQKIAAFSSTQAAGALYGRVTMFMRGRAALSGLLQNLLGLLTVATTPDANTLTATKGGVQVNTATVGSGLVRKVTPMTVAMNFTVVLQPGALMLRAASQAITTVALAGRVSTLGMVRPLLVPRAPLSAKVLTMSAARGVVGTGTGGTQITTITVANPTTSQIS